METTQIIRRPCVTEKSIQSSEAANKVVFEVDMRANKTQVKKAVEELFKVTVLKVNTLWMPAKQVRMGKRAGMRPAWKKAVVTLKEGDKIEFFETA
ncbi:MAG: 50S ribosomal protein L23 [Candidatus Tectomicrobia bacterium]|uniref:Large ribosomal subunit protein uL23 n=1 Tax=Tectimicrobiota bacterium TaxID=2528274 RepID=A0A932HZB0_UNCTE|nr:50S ribosomal protein L23 [Candidatus Tectomicrobia bacterium]